MSGINKAIIVGNLGRDPETRTMPNGTKVATLSIATSEHWKDQTGEKQERTEWHRVVIFGRLGEVAGQYLKKGAKVYIEGRIQTRKWTDSNGVDRFSTEIIASVMTMLDGKGKDSDFTSQQYRDAKGGTSSDTGLDDEIPF